MSKVVLGIADENLESDLRSLIEEMRRIEVVAVATDSAKLVEYAVRFEPDLVLLHDGLGPDPTGTVLRELVARRPSAAILQVSPERSNSTVIRALEAGARGVVAYPFAFEDFSVRVQDALDWSQQMQRVLSGAAAVLREGRGQVLVLAGAKGGVGVTTMTLHLAIDHHREDPGARVCVVDLDVEKGDVSALLDVRQSVSVADLAKVHQDLSAGTVSDAVIEHASGVHLMLAPTDVRESEHVTPEALRSIVTLLRREFDLIVIDAGGYVSPAQAAALELADEVLVVTTPDVLSVRALRKRILAWEDLGVRSEGELNVVVNKVDRSSIFPAEAVAKLTTAEVLATHIPLSVRVLESAVNERDPQAVTDLTWWRLMTGIRRELRLSGAPSGRHALPAPSEPAERTPRRGLLRRSGERGAIALENVALVPLVLGFVLVMWQVAILGLGAVWLGQAAATATRSYAISGSSVTATEEARQKLPEPFASGLSVSAEGDEVTVTLALPEHLALLDELSSTHVVTREPR